MEAAGKKMHTVVDSQPKLVPQASSLRGHPLVCYTNTGHHHPSLRPAKHLFMA